MGMISDIKIDSNVATALLELYSEATDYPIGLYEGQRVIVPERSFRRFRGYCQKLHSLGLRRQCDADHKRRGARAAKEGFEMCYAGLLNYTLPIRVRGQVRATLLCGQVRLKDSVSERLSKKCREQVYSHLRLDFEQRRELERLYQDVTIVDPEKDEVPLVNHLRAIQKQFYELLSLNLKLEQESELFDQSQENIAHELQIRLQGLWADSENLQRALRVGRPVSRQVYQDAEEVLKGVQRLNVLVQNFRLGLGEYEWKKSHIEGLVRESVALYETEAERKSIAFDLEVEEAYFEMSERHIAHMMNNLVHNAVKYSYRGTRERDRVIKIRGKRKPEFYELEIENFGVGILPEEMDRIFEKSYRGELTRDESRTGAGLGLAIAKEIVESHEGSIGVSSHKVDSAYLTRFTIRLPLSKSGRRSNVKAYNLD
jgi:signal transduction histidine kinase